MSGDANYNGKFATSVPPPSCPSCSLINNDNDTPGFVLTGTSGLQTSESHGTASFGVALATQPSPGNTVTLPLSSSNTNEGTVAPPALLFTTTDWSTPHPVTITGVDDLKADGLQQYSIVFGPASGDAGYNNTSPPPVSVSNADNDVEGVNVTPTTCSTTPGTSQMISIVLNSQPGDNVTINLASDTPTEGKIDQPTIVFTPANWNVAQFVTVTGVDDGTMMSAMTQYKIVTTNASSPGDTTGYNGADVADITCTNTTTAPTPPPMP
jgi:hypothetical protein